MSATGTAYIEQQRHCGCCHACGAKLIEGEGGAGWCYVCRTYRCYPSHGWSPDLCDPEDRDSECEVAG